MKKRTQLWMAPIVALLTAGLLSAADNTWLFPVPNLAGLKTGDLIYARDPNNLGNISTDGSLAGQVLQSNGAGVQPSWGATGISGAFSSITGLNATTGTFSGLLRGGTLIITNGINSATANLSGLTASVPVFTDSLKNLTSVGTVPVNQGGTGNVTYSTGMIVLSTASGNLTGLAVGTQGQLLQAAGGAVAPAWSSTLATGIASQEVTGSVFLDAPTYCHSDEGEGGVQQNTTTGVLHVTRYGPAHWWLQRTAQTTKAAETYIVYCSLNSMIQRLTSANNKGIKITSLNIVYTIGTANLTSHTWGRVSTIQYATGPSGGITTSVGDLATGIAFQPVRLETVALAAIATGTYVNTTHITTPIYFPANSQTGMIMEWTAVLPNTSIYAVMGVHVNFSRTDM